MAIGGVKGSKKVGYNGVQGSLRDWRGPKGFQVEPLGFKCGSSGIQGVFRGSRELGDPRKV